jgi:hypothetical protein
LRGQIRVEVVELDRSKGGDLPVPQHWSEVRASDPLVGAQRRRLDGLALHDQPPIQQVAEGHRCRGGVASLVDFDEQPAQVPFGIPTGPADGLGYVPLGPRRVAADIGTDAPALGTALLDQSSHGVRSSAS